MNTILMMYVTLLSPILAGIINSMFCKSTILNSLKIPMDGGKKLKDKKRIFGDHKTWKGFLGYIVLNILMALIYGLISKVSGLDKYNYFYVEHTNTIPYNLLIGFLLGLGYALFELPNSFIKRRIGIKEGKNATGFTKWIFVFIDQADSVFGCCLVVWLFYDLGILKYLLYVFLGAITHILINMALYFCKLRKNMF